MKETIKILTPREEKELLKARVQSLAAKLPANWILLFIHDNIEYKNRERFLSNVKRQKSLHAPTIEKIENWIKTLN